MNIKSKLFFFIVFCFLSLNSYSQGWIKIASYKKNGTITYLNDAYESYQNDIVAIWEKVEYEVFVYNNKKHPYGYLVTLREFDIINKKTRMLYQIAYDKDGNVIYSEDNTQLNWKWIAPYTTGELEYEYCKNIVN